MYTMVVMAALAVPGHGGQCCSDYASFGGVYAHGYGSHFAVARARHGGVVPMPNWHGDAMSDFDTKHWNEYMSLLDGQEKEDLERVWAQATPEARKTLLAKIPAVYAAASVYREQVAKERAVERYKEENRPMEEEELEVWNEYIVKFKGWERKIEIAKWRGTDNRGRRMMLKEIIRQQLLLDE